MNDEKNKEQINTIFAAAPSDSKLEIRIIGGTTDVNKNMYLYEYDDEIILVDCGIGYPDMDTPGVDVLIPDFTYVLENSHKVKALFITHAHADHIAAVPYLLQELPEIPIYGSKFVIEMIKRSLMDRNFKHLAEGTHFHQFDPLAKPEGFKYFKFTAFGVNHSVPESQAYVIDTPEGKVMHVSDYKFDPTPVLDKPFDEATVTKNAEQGIMVLLSDCLSVDKGTSPKSEATLNQTFFEIMEKAQGRQLFVTMLSSNVSRMNQLATAAIKYGRKVVASGRTIETVMDIAKTIGYLPFSPENFVHEDDAHSYPQNSLVYIIAGCYGQPESALGRLSRGEHKKIKLEKKAIVVFSGEPGPPEISVPVERLTDTLILQGIEVIDGDVMENLHVSGHGGLDNMVKLAKLSHPKYFIPVGGSITKMHHYKQHMGMIGFNETNVFTLLEGECAEFKKGVGKKGRAIQEKPVYISAGRGEELSPQIIRDRENLSDDGVFVVVFLVDSDGKPIPGKIEVITRGFIYVKENKALMNKSRDAIGKSLNKAGNKQDLNALKGVVEKDISKFLYKETGRSPLVLVHAISL
jgi:ribonuclease J